MMATFLALMVSGLPVAMAMAGAALIYVMLSGNLPDFVVIHRMYGGVDSFPLLAVPFFIWAGNLMNSAGITNRIYNFALALVGWMKGGLGHVNVVGSMIFAGMSGTAIADAAGLGTIEIKAMQDHGYPTEFAVGVTAASATVGPIIPPSLPFVIYGMMAGVSIGQLFLAGVIPGILMGITMMLTVGWFAHKRNYGRDAKFSAPKLLKASLEIVTVACVPGSAWLLFTMGLPGGWAVIVSFAVLLLLDRLFNFSAVMALLTPVLLIGGMTMGVFTPTEGAIAASMWALFLGLAWYRTLDWRRLIKITMDTIETTATVLFIVAAASIFGWLLTVTRVTDAVAEWVLAFTHDPNMFLLLANLLMLFVGCFLEPVAAITLLVPILIPICQKLGIDLVHFGLVMVLNLMIGLLHPPMGTVLFVLSRVAKLSFERTTIAILPWLAPLLLTLGLCTYVPAIVLWLPKQFF
ncbi:MAG: ABC transporter permease [Betaproteobacteria bacterium RBG_16_66_20]|nr:MAG: ABC transporter permease [Betaproteobacteria bacterium RBG_16_66_20]